MANKTYTVTVASGDLYGGGTGNVFYLDGARNATGPGTVSWVADSTLRFDQSDGTNDNHPLIFSTTTSRDQYLTSGVTYYLDGTVSYSDYTNTTTFNAATTRYVEVTPSSFTDFYYLCYVHGIGMGGIMDMVANSWGAHPYNQGAWNQNQDLTVFVTNPNDTLWGRDTWGTYFWGGGGNMDMSLNNSGITITNEINVGWGSDTWGTETWGQSGNRHAVTGIAMSMAEGLSGATINGDSNLTLSGNAATMATGTVDAFSAFVAEPTGLAMVAQLNFNPAFAQPSGFAMSAALGTATLDANTIADVTTSIAGYWGYKSAWGNFAWGNGTTETLAMSMLEGTLDPAPDAMLTGNAAAIALGNETITGTADLTITGEAATIALGTAVGDANTQVDITGFVLTAALGDETITGTATVDLTGFGLTFSLGTATNVLIWNAVDTGSAPTTPPGWQEVPTNAA